MDEDRRDFLYDSARVSAFALASTALWHSGEPTRYREVVLTSWDRIVCIAKLLRKADQGANSQP